MPITLDNQDSCSPEAKGDVTRGHVRGKRAVGWFAVSGPCPCAPNQALERTRRTAPLSSVRVCQAWDRACGVQVPTPDMSGAEGEEKGKGVIARWRLEEAPSKGAGRRPGTGYEVWDHLGRAGT